MKAITPNLGILSGCLLAGFFFPLLTQAGESLQLFNGKDLKGWHAYLNEHGVAKADVWSVRDGLLVCAGEPMGYLYTDQAFESFKLIVEWRWAPGKKAGNSGVLMRVNAEPRPLPRCYEAQLKSGNAGTLYGLHDMRIDGPPERKLVREPSPLAGRINVVNKIDARENPPGEWNRYEIIFDKGNLQVWINGGKVNEAWDCEVLAGPIGLQSEGGEIHFRQVELTPLD